MQLYLKVDNEKLFSSCPVLNSLIIKWSLKQTRFWATYVNRKSVDLSILGLWFCPHFRANRLCKNKDTKQKYIDLAKAKSEASILDF